jgi:hypothetical protein
VNTRWRTRSSSGPPRAPVELRFIDMFMTALGSLIFLALLLVFLVRWLPKQPSVADRPHVNTTAELRIVTAILLPGRVDDPYSMAIAYRDGSGHVSWSISPGPDALPPGTTFNAAQGIISGSPTEEGIFRFVVAATDDTGGRDSRDYQILVERSLTSHSSVGIWVAAVLVAFIGFLAFILRGGASSMRAHAARAQAAYDRNESTYQHGSGAHGVTIYELPQGIGQLHALAVSWQRKSRILTVCAVLVGIYLIWAIWSG